MKEKMAKIRAKKLQNMQCSGSFQSLHKIGISRKDVQHAGRVAGKAVANTAIDTVANIAGAYGVPVPTAVTDSLKTATDHLIDGNHQKAINAVREPAKAIMKKKINNK
jgi:hypothetical protein